jgi:D-aminopeptidase
MTTATREQTSNQFIKRAQHMTHTRFRDYGFTPGLLPTGKTNLISDIKGVKVGHLTKIEASDIRTGVTVIDPGPQNIFRTKLSAGLAVGNGFGKSAGTTQIVEFGTLETPIALTNTHAVGAAMRGLIDLTTAHTPDLLPYESINAFVGETNDWIVNNIHTNAIVPGDVTTAWNARVTGFELGSVGAGTGTRAFSWKGGIGSASRMVTHDQKHYTVGTLVQTNFGGALTIMGVPVGQILGADPSFTFLGHKEPDGSCMIILATDAPLSSRQLTRLAKRALLGLPRTGSVMATSSGDYALAFSTSHTETDRELLSDNDLNDFFLAAAEACEESIYDALFTASSITGRDHYRLEALPIDRVVDILSTHIYQPK